MKIHKGLVLAAFASLTLVGCGGGGDSGSSQTSPIQVNQTYNLSAALKSLTANGWSANLNVNASNGCSGTGSYTVGGATTAAVFEGKAALSATSMLNISYKNCTPAIQSITSTSYYDSNYLPLGAQSDSYLVWSSVNIPSTIKVGDVAVIGDAVRYSNNTKTSKTGTAQLSAVVEADTQNSAFITVSTKAYTSANVLESTQLTKYRIDTSNNLTIVSLTIQYANGVTLVMTKA